MHREQRRQQAEGQRQHAQQGRLSSEQQRHTNEEVRQTGEDTSPQRRQRWHHGKHMDAGMRTALVWRPRRGMRTSKGGYADHHLRVTVQVGAQPAQHRRVATMAQAQAWAEEQLR